MGEPTKIGKIPEFKNVQELIAWHEKQSKKNVESVAKKPREIDPDEVWQVRALYQQPGISWQKLMVEAKEERKYAGDTVIVWIHEHKYGEDCVKNCKEVLNPS